VKPPFFEKFRRIARVAKSDLGTKRICPTTGKKFYDLNKNPVISPYTGEVVRIAPIPPPRTRADAAARARAAAAASAAEATPEPVEAEELVARDARSVAAIVEGAPAELRFHNGCGRTLAISRPQARKDQSPISGYGSAR
jgi:uncharacterized protein (TIGR02300 family)